jgi:cysteine desulfurase
MGVNPRRARGSIRLSLGIYNTAAEVDFLLQHLPGIVAKLRAISPLSPEHPDNDRYDARAVPHAHHHHAEDDEEHDAVAT